MKESKKNFFVETLKNKRELNVLFIVVIAGFIISLIKPTFMTQFNIQVILRQLAVFGILAIAETFVIIVLGIDLSVGSVVAFGGILTAIIINATGSALLAIFGVLGVAVFIGFYHGFMVTRIKMAPFIVTLGSLSLFRGLSFVISKGYPLLIDDERIRWLGQGLIGPFPVPFVIFVGVALCTGFILHFTTLGRSIYAIGGNPEAARMSGIPVNRVLIFVYIQATLLSSIVGLIIAGRLAQGLASVAVGYELIAIAAAIIGGASFLGGIGTIVGTAFGALLMSMIDNALITLRVDPYWYNFVTGVIIILAVSIDTAIRKRRRASS